MSDYNLSQSLNYINESNYDDDIGATVAPNHFIAVTSNKLNEDKTQRIMTVEVMVLKGVPGGNVHTNSGLYVRAQHETSVKVVLTRNRQELATNVAQYPD